MSSSGTSKAASAGALAGAVLVKTSGSRAIKGTSGDTLPRAEYGFG